MTTDEFNARYKVLKEIAHGNGRSFTAQETASGRAVLVHFLPENMLLAGRQLADTLDQLPARDRSKVLEILTVGKSTVVVTQFLENFENFDHWLQGRVAGGSVPPSNVPQEPALPAGDFTKLFEQSSAASGTVPPPLPAPGRPPRDSFTELFQTPPEPRAHLHPAQSPAPPPVEILRVRIPPSSPAPPPPAPPRPSPPMPSWPGALDPPSSPGPLPPLPNPMLGAPAQKPRGAEPIIKPPSRDPLPPPVPVAGWSGASDYTRQLSAVPAPADPAPVAVAPASAAAAAAPAGASRSIVPLLLVLNIVVVIATGVVVYFALKRC